MTTGAGRRGQPRGRGAIGEAVRSREVDGEEVERRLRRTEVRHPWGLEQSRVVDRLTLARSTLDDHDSVARALTALRPTSRRRPEERLVEADTDLDRAVDPEGPRWIRATAISVSLLLPTAAAIALMFYEPRGAPATSSDRGGMSAATARATPCGSVIHSRRGALPAGAALFEGDTISSRELPGCVTLARGALACLQPHTQVRVLSLDPSGPVLDLERGEVTIRAVGRGPAPELTAGVVRLRGASTYSVSRRGAIRVRVAEGQVHVRSTGWDASLGASQVAVIPESAGPVSVGPLSSLEGARVLDTVACGEKDLLGLAKN